jgi:hypothetical protein
MTPKELRTALLQIATDIDAAERPDPNAVIKEINRVASVLKSTETARVALTTTDAIEIALKRHDTLSDFMESLKKVVMKVYHDNKLVSILDSAESKIKAVESVAV